MTSWFKKLHLLNNKTFIYLITRYITYAIQFASSLIIAQNLGPYYLGVWGFLLLIINYFRILDMGIPNAINIILVQHKGDVQKGSDYINGALMLITFIGLVIILAAVYYYYFGFPLFEKYPLGSLFYIVCGIAIVSNFNILFMNIYRAKNSLNELTIFQSLIPTIVFAIALLYNGEILLKLMLAAYFVGNVISFIMFYYGEKIPKIAFTSWEISQTILSKGFNLFIYNASWYLIFLSIKTLISIYYTVNEFGLFTFSFTIASSVLLLLQTVVFVAFPKVVDKLNGAENGKSIIREIDRTYTVASYGLVFFTLMFYPYFLEIFDKYQDSYLSLVYTSLTVLISINSFGHATYLMANNKEKIISIASFCCLLFNILIAFILIKIFLLPFHFIVISSIIAYFSYTLAIVYLTNKHLGRDYNFISMINDTFPLRLLIPYVIIMILVYIEYQAFIFLPFLIYLILNLATLKSIYQKFLILLHKPESLDI